MKFYLLLLSGLVATCTMLSQDCTTSEYIINVGSFYFNPIELTVEPGSVIGFNNEEGFHNINGDISVLTGESFGNPETFSLPAVNGGPSVCMGTITLTIPGTYTYDCSIGSHAANGMVGTIVVQEASIPGCSDPTACNYNGEATENDGSCVYAINACETCEGDSVIVNDLDGDGTCDFPGCTSYFASNYSPTATYNDTTCNYDLQQFLLEGTTISDLLFSGVLEEELIGKFAAGGVILDIDQSNSRALIASAHSRSLYYRYGYPSNHYQNLCSGLLAEELIGFQFGSNLYDGKLNWSILQKSFGAKYGYINSASNAYGYSESFARLVSSLKMMGYDDWFIPNQSELTLYTELANSTQSQIEWPTNPNGTTTELLTVPIFSWDSESNYSNESYNYWNDQAWATSEILNAGEQSNFITNELVKVKFLSYRKYNDSWNEHLGNYHRPINNSGYLNIMPMRIEELDDVNTSISCKDWDYNNSGNQATDAGLTCFYPLFNCDSTESDVWNELVIGIYPATASVVEYGRSDTRDVLINIPETHEIDGNVYEVLEYEVTGISNVPTGLDVNLNEGDFIAGGDAHCLAFSEYALEEGIYDLDIAGILYMDILGSTLTADITLEHRVVVTENQTGVQGCIYPTADNYNVLATDDDGTCVFAGTCPGDFDDDGLIDVMDILYLLGIYNTPCE